MPAPERTTPWHRGALQCGLAAVLFGATTPLASHLAADIAAPTLAGLLYLGAALAVLPLFGRHTSPGAVLRSGGRRLATAVVAGGLVGPVLLAAGLARTSAATASLLLNLELVGTVVIAAAFFREHLGRRVAAGAAPVVAAGVTLAWSDAPGPRLGALLIIAACTRWGLDTCVTADLDQIAPHHITLAKGVIAGGTNPAVGVAVTGAAARGQLVFSTAPFVGVVVAWTILRDAQPSPRPSRSPSPPSESSSSSGPATSTITSMRRSSMNTRPSTLIGHDGVRSTPSNRASPFVLSTSGRTRTGTRCRSFASNPRVRRGGLHRHDEGLSLAYVLAGWLDVEFQEIGVQHLGVGTVVPAFLLARSLGAGHVGVSPGGWDVSDARFQFVDVAEGRIDADPPDGSTVRVGKGRRDDLVLIEVVTPATPR